MFAATLFCMEGLWRILAGALVTAALGLAAPSYADVPVPTDNAFVVPGASFAKLVKSDAPAGRRHVETALRAAKVRETPPRIQSRQRKSLSKATG